MSSIHILRLLATELIRVRFNQQEAVETTIDVFRLDCKPSAVELFMDIKGRHVHVGERGYSCIPPLQEVFVRVGISQQQQPSSTHSNHLPQSS